MSVLKQKSTFRFLPTFLVLVFFAFLLSFPSDSNAQAVPTTISVSGGVLQSGVSRLGVNLGDQDYWDSAQIMKNLIFENPGFEGLKYRVIFHCDAVTGTTCTDDNQYNAQPTGFWVGGNYQVMSGNAAGATGTVTAFTNNKSTCAGCGPTITFDKSVNLAVGDYFSVGTYIPGSGDTGWWDDISGGGSITTETTDLSPETPGKQAVVLNASGAGQAASVTQYFDSFSHLSFVQLNGSFAVTFRAKGVGGNNQLTVNVERLSTGASPYLYQTLQLTNTWQDYTLTFSANETGSALGTVQLMLGATGGSVELDDVAMQQTNSSASNPTAFRDDVVNALKELNPGTIRMMASGAALGSDLPNQLQVPFARYRGGFNADGTSVSSISYGIHEFLQLCQTVGADPYITIPTATTPAEMTDFIEYLTGTGGDPWSALRISRGQVAPWTTVFGKIHLELGNETWNGIFKGESMIYPGYPQWANTVFGAARQTPGFVASQFDLVLSGWSAVAGFDAQLLTASTEHDSIDIAPYLLFSANNEAQSTMFGALFAEPELFESAGGQVYQDMQVATAAPSATASATNLNVYETNLSPIEGNITATELNQLTPSVGAGLAHTEHMLQMMRLGIKYQNAFALPQYAFMRSDGSLVKLWGIVVDMGTTNRRRPQFLTQALANSVIGGTMLTTAHSGANPTWNQPLSSDSVQLNGAHYLQSFAFLNGTTSSVMVFNLNQTTALPVTFSGENAPAGTVQMTQITSANITDNNETSTVVTPATQTLSSFNAATGLTLPPFSMTLLSWTSTFAQAPNFSVPAGTYSAAQTVSLSSVTPGAAIYYTTDGSTPTASSTLYTGAIAVSKTETLNAISVAPNLSASPVASALYTIQPVASSPVFAPGTGTYTSGQSVGISAAVSGATIYYTTDGSTPTTSSNVYTGPVTVSTNQTLSAIAAAANYTNSATATAVYTIAPPTPTPTFNMAAGTYTVGQLVQIGDSLSGAVFYYTLDGSTPTTSSTRYSSYVTVSATATLKAIAVVPGYSSSAVASAAYTIAPYAATPTLSVPGGTYAAAQSVVLSDTTPGAKIYYTTNQVTPTASSTLYTGPVVITGSQYLQAIAVAPGYTSSFVGAGMFTITGTTVATPIFSVPGGTYTAAQTVTISDATAGATVYYTTNGTTPTTASNKYSSPINVGASETLQAIAAAPTTTASVKTATAAATAAVSSAVATATYTIQTAVATPTFSVASGTYASAQTVALADATSGAVIYYTTNGATPTTASTKYTGAITVSSSETIKAIAVATNSTASAVATSTYAINTTAATPAFSVTAGTYSSSQTVALADGTSGAVIYYTTNGATPTTASTKYTAAIIVNTSETIKAIAIATNSTASAVATATYAITATAATPTFSVAAGTYASTQTVALADATSGAVIYYTTNGSTPTTASTKYTSAITISGSETVKAIATATNYATSPVATATYAISSATPTPTFSVPAGTYAHPQIIQIGDASNGAVIYYTTDGTTPTTSSTRYSSYVTVSKTATLKAIAVNSGHAASTAQSATYTIAPYAALPVLSVPSGKYSAPQTVTISDATPGAVIYYTTNQSTPTTSSTKYTGPVWVDGAVYLQAIAVAPGYSQSFVASAMYTTPVSATTPSLSLVSGSYTGKQTVTVANATAGAAIYYTTNGTTPTTASTRYTSPIEVNVSVTLKVIAAKSGLANSAAVSATYVIKTEAAAVPTFSVKAGKYSTEQTVKISDETSGAEIYYTTNGSEPTKASTKYTAAIKVSANETIKAIAVAADHSNSSAATAAYAIEAATPTVSVKAGTYAKEQTVTISDGTRDAVIYYTTNGTTPTTASTKYTGPIKVSAKEAIKAIAVATGYSESSAITASYVVD